MPLEVLAVDSQSFQWLQECLQSDLLGALAVAVAWREVQEPIEPQRQYVLPLRLGCPLAQRRPALHARQTHWL